MESLFSGCATRKEESAVEYADLTIKGDKSL